MQLMALSKYSDKWPAPFIEALRQRRIELGLTQLEVALRIPTDAPDGHAHQSSVATWEKGRSVPPPNIMAKWAEALGVRVVVGLQAIPGDQQ